MRHASLPATITDAQLASWLQANSKEKFKDPNKVMFTEDELNGKARTAAANGAEISLLEEILATVQFAVTKGNPEVLTIEIPVTDGKKVLDANIKGLHREVARGYESKERDIFGIPDEEAETMQYFTITGELVADRTRPLSAKEIRDYCGLLRGSFNKAVNE